jgi:hypothetical protein
MNLISQDELNLLSDSRYKNYVTSIEKCLKNFESSTEWADLISSLGKLKKVSCVLNLIKYKLIKNAYLLDLTIISKISIYS